MRKWLLWSLFLWILGVSFVTTGRHRKRASSVYLISTQTPTIKHGDGSSSMVKMMRKARDDDELSSSSTTTESIRSRVLHYMLSNPRFRSVHELFQIIRNSMTVQSSSSALRTGKSAKTNATDDDNNAILPRQGFENADASSANATGGDELAAAESNRTDVRTGATSLTDVDAPSTSEPVSSTRSNGVYFYVDWNSFLNMTPSSGDPISLNFSPKAGNRRFFTSFDIFNRLAEA